MRALPRAFWRGWSVVAVGRLAQFVEPRDRGHVAGRRTPTTATATDREKEDRIMSTTTSAPTNTPVTDIELSIGGMNP